MARLLPQVQGMTYAQDEENVYVTFYAGSSTTAKVAGIPVTLTQKTNYPNDGKIQLRIAPRSPAKFKLQLRIPTWARDRFVPGELYTYAKAAEEQPVLRVNGKNVDYKIEKGFAMIERTWKKGDQVELDLPMSVKVSHCHKAVEANHNRIALTRGPFVLCAEGVDNEGATQRFFFDSDAPDLSDSTIGKANTPHGSFVQTTVEVNELTRSGGAKSATMKLIPYYAWNNRGPASMTVWFPSKKELAIHDPLALPKESIFKNITASHTSKSDTVNAIGDQVEPRWSSGNKTPRWTSRGQEGKPQTITGEFHGTKQIRSIGVYWMDHYQHPVKFPKEWKVETRKDGKWEPFQLYTTDRYDTRANQYNVIHPAAPLSCDAIRIHATPREEYAVGILEVQVAFEK